MKRVLDVFKTNVTPEQAKKLIIAIKDVKRTWTRHYMYLVTIAKACSGTADYLVFNHIAQYASSDLRTVLMTKEDYTKNDKYSRPKS